MSNAKTLHLQFADGEIEVGTLIDALYEQERTIAILRQHKNDYMEAAEGTRKALEAENARLERLVSHWQGLAVTNRKVADDALAQLAAPQPHPVVSQKMIAAAEEAYMPFGDMGFALTAALAAMDYDGAEQ